MLPEVSTGTIETRHIVTPARSWIEKEVIIKLKEKRRRHKRSNIIHSKKIIAPGKFNIK